MLLGQDGACGPMGACCLAWMARVARWANVAWPTWSSSPPFVFLNDTWCFENRRVRAVVACVLRSVARDCHVNWSLGATSGVSKLGGVCVTVTATGAFEATSAVRVREAQKLTLKARGAQADAEGAKRKR